MTSDVFKTLSAINVNDYKEKKGQFDYLSWTDAWLVLMQHYPDATHDMLEDVYYPDGTMEVRSSVTINGVTQKMFLPVIDHRNKAITNPNAFDINKNRMRCLVKNIALFGLGIYIFQGEDFPEAPHVTFTQEQKEKYLSLMATDDIWGLKRFVDAVGGPVMDELFNAAPKGEKSKQKELARGMIQRANHQLKEALNGIREAIDNESVSALHEIWAEMGDLEMEYIHRAMSEVEKAQIQRLEEAAS